VKLYEILIGLAFVSATIGGWLIHPALAFFIAAGCFAALGWALSLEPERETYTAPEGLDGLVTASPDSEA
jgi:hypothetical protein